jgi:hypothetical protein
MKLIVKARIEVMVIALTVKLWIMVLITDSKEYLDTITMAIEIFVTCYLRNFCFLKMLKFIQHSCLRFVQAVMANLEIIFIYFLLKMGYFRTLLLVQNCLNWRFNHPHIPPNFWL